MEPISSDFEDIVLTLCEDVASPRALTVALLLRSREWDQLVSLRVDPKHYLRANDFWRDNLVTSLLVKCDGLPTSFDRKKKAIDQFYACEEMCFRSNRRLERLLFPGGASAPSASDVLAIEVFSTAKRIISECLGPFPFSDLSGKFGPGSTYGDRGGLTTIPDKMSSRPTLTPSAWTSLSDWRSTAWARACALDGRQPEVVRGNRFLTVPKDATKFRGIAVEPSINVFYQLSIGKLIRARLRRLGIHLDVGQDIHGRLAHEASSQGHLCTLDLSNASDTICRNLVEFLLPPSWFEVLSDLRSPTTLIDGRTVILEKFSSMGNGFTFELETLIFYALTKAVYCHLGDHEALVSVFGDDIISPSKGSDAVIAFLALAGFKVNESKSFTDGLFRESCGEDFFSGTRVRAHYVRSIPEAPEHFITLANGLRRSAGDRFPWLYRTWRRVLDRIPVQIRCCRGPSDLGDIVIHDDEIRWNKRRRSSIRYVRVYRPVSGRKVHWSHFKPHVILAAATYGVSSGDSFRIHPNGTHRLPQNRLGVTPRDSVTGHKLGWVAFS
ncbi:MAG: RNA replicase beta chain [Sanya fiers-like virus 1]|nr:MAG: RNA replicase beta chain [Sanya fiers-like virus 1]UYL94450.1 MAG: RNA replicase beta chain [Sanya fiers-like virus 1]